MVVAWGKIYERSAITEWLEKHHRSPSTNNPMGTKLLPATQVRNMIERLVKGDIIVGEKAKSWQAKLQTQEILKNMRAGAEAGNVHNIYKLGCAYQAGEHGLVTNYHEALCWYRRGALLNDPQCLRRAGDILLHGRGGTAQQPVDGLIFMVRAAENSDVAACTLGKIYHAGLHGVAKDMEHAKYWLTKATDGTCKLKHLKDVLHADAKKLLLEL